MPVSSRKRLSYIVKSTTRLHTVLCLSQKGMVINMKKENILILALLLFCSIVFISCDPIYPPGNLMVVKIEPLSQGSSVDVEIIYPNTGGSVVLEWKEQNIEIMDGEDIIAISGFTITGISRGTARIKVNATTVISDEAAERGYEERIYSTEFRITVT